MTEKVDSGNSAFSACHGIIKKIILLFNFIFFHKAACISHVF